jgi:multidrug resistance efflux pump
VFSAEPEFEIENRAQAEKVLAEQEIKVRSVGIKQIEATIRKAAYELARTEVRSPVSGRVAPFQARPGTILEVGKPVLALVSTDNWRVVANISERHLSALRTGQKVWYTIGSPANSCRPGNRIAGMISGVIILAVICTFLKARQESASLKSKVGL